MAAVARDWCQNRVNRVVDPAYKALSWATSGLYAWGASEREAFNSKFNLNDIIKA